MSKISLQPNASGAGTFSIVAPDSNTNRTLTLPDESGTVFSDGTGVPGSALTGNISINDATINGQLTANNNIRSLKPVFFGDTNQPMEFSPFHFVHGFDTKQPDSGTTVDLVTLDYSNASDFVEQSVFIEFGARVQGGSTADSNSHSFSRIYGINRFTGSISLNGPSTRGTDSVREVFVRVERISDSLVKIQAVFESDRPASFCWGQIRSYMHGNKFNTGFYANDGDVNITFDHGWN